MAYEPYNVVDSSLKSSSSQSFKEQLLNEFQTIPGLMSNWLTCSKPGLGVWMCWWWWWWWWWSNGALSWCGDKIIVLLCCWCCCTCNPLTSMPSCELLLCAVGLLLLLLLGELWCKSLVFGSSESLHDSDDPFLALPGVPLPLCVFTCFAKWSDLMKRLLQTGQANLFSPLIRLKRFKS